MDAWIIIIGNEILNGRVLDTNSNFLARELTMMGFNVRRIITVPDDMDEIVEVIRDAYRKSRIIITTGGLGPTFDDLTSEALSRALGLEWVINRDAYRMVEEKYKAAGMEMTEERVKMARMPSMAKPLYNPVGTAPGILIDYNDRIIVSLPGVPDEMKAIFEESVRGLLTKIAPRRIYLEEIYRIVGIPESSLAPLIKEVLRKYPNVYIKSHPRGRETRGPVIDLALSTYSRDVDESKKIIQEIVGYIKEITGITPIKQSKN